MIKVDNERKLEVAQDFVEFIKAHNRKVSAIKNANCEDIFDIAVRQASLINEMAKALATKQTEISGLKVEVEEMRKRVDDLEREVRVSRDLLEIAKAIDDAK